MNVTLVTQTGNFLFEYLVSQRVDLILTAFSHGVSMRPAEGISMIYRSNM